MLCVSNKIIIALFNRNLQNKGCMCEIEEEKRNVEWIELKVIFIKHKIDNRR